MEALSARVTAGDVAARAGIRVSEAETALNALAADTLGTLQVCLNSILHYKWSSGSRCVSAQGMAAVPACCWPCPALPQLSISAI